MKAYIYLLRDPRDNAVRYVGITVAPQARRYQHTRPAGANRAKDEWLRSLQCCDLTPKFEVVDIVHDGGGIGLHPREMDWIRRLHAAGADLLNREARRL